MTQADQLAAQAAQWQAAGRADMAAQLYAAALEQDPGKFALRMQFAECLAYLGQVDQAGEQYLMVAQAYAARGRHQECMAICERLIAIAPHAFVYMSVGPMVRRIGRQARTLCARAAEAHLKAGRQTDGLQILRLGAELDPHNPDVRRQLARIYQARHMMREAVEALTDAGNLLLQAKRYEEYVQVAEQVLGLEPRDIDTLRDLPRVYLELRKPHEAVRCLGRLTKVSPGDIIGYEILAQAFALIGRTDKALSVLERLVDELGATGQADKADAILNHARYWRPTDIGFLRSIKRIEVPRPEPKAVSMPQEAAPEGTVVLNIADLLVDEGASTRAPGGGVKLTEAEGMTMLNLDDLMIDDMQQAAGLGVSPATTPPAGRSPPPPPGGRRPPPGRSKQPLPPVPKKPAADINATMSLDASDLIEALGEFSSPGEPNPWSDAPTRPEREEEEHAFEAPDPGLATVALHVPEEHRFAPAPVEPAMTPAIPHAVRPSISELIYDDDEGDVDSTTSVDLREREEDEPATLLHMKPLTAEDIARAMAQQSSSQPQPVQPQAWSPPPHVVPEPIPREPTPVSSWSPPSEPVPAAWSPPPMAPPASESEPEPPSPRRGGMGDEAPTMARLTPLSAADIARALSSGSSTRPPPGAVDEDAATRPPPASYSRAAPYSPPGQEPPPVANASAEPEPPPLLQPAAPRVVAGDEAEEEATMTLEALRPEDLLRYANRGSNRGPGHGGDASGQ
ncbi:tetratricopeptide repeat protein [Paraliomyxa miuraensis]|uniref:tetratricopeptide repeat protein n=1 Tax=Paraliomyxa miuraensis TaxID=376150 RepID=UPI0022565284|nr:hypothetical protein [Paraliomyxa miuraensis]MCX4246525.1 hypothetical protein [Paraliomyxa miuraensis]